MLPPRAREWMMSNVFNLEELRAGKQITKAVALVRESLIATLGERSRAGVEAPESAAAIESYIGAAWAMKAADEAFNGTAESADALSVAALAYRDARRAFDAQVERITRAAMGLGEH